MNHKQITFAQLLGVSIFAGAVPGLGMILLPLVWVACGGKYAWAFFGWMLLLALPEITQIAIGAYTFSNISVPATIHYAAQHSGAATASTAGHFVQWLFTIPNWERYLIVGLMELSPIFVLACFLGSIFFLMKAGKEKLRKTLQPYVKFQL